MLKTPPPNAGATGVISAAVGARGVAANVGVDEVQRAGVVDAAPVGVAAVCVRPARSASATLPVMTSSLSVSVALLVEDPTAVRETGSSVGLAVPPSIVTPLIVIWLPAPVV